MNIRSDLFGYALEIGRPLRTSCISCGDLRDDPLGVQLLWGPPRHIRTQHVQEPALHRSARGVHGRRLHGAGACVGSARLQRLSEGGPEVSASTECTML